MDDDIAELQCQLSKARTEGERVRLRRLIAGEPEPVPSAAGPTPPNDQVLDDLIRAIAPPRGAQPSDLVEVQIRALMQLIECARYGDTLRWQRTNHVPARQAVVTSRLDASALGAGGKRRHTALMLLLNLALAGALALVCVLIHFGGLIVLQNLIRSRLAHLHDRRELGHQSVVVLAAVGGLFLLHTAEIWAYTLAIYWIGAMDDLTHALYFCIATYSTIGYGDVVLAEEWRVFGSTQAVVGLLLMGWSTAFLVTVVGRLRAFADD